MFAKTPDLNQIEAHDTYPNAPPEHDVIDKFNNENEFQTLNFSPKFAILQRSMNMVTEKQKNELTFYKSANLAKENVVCELELAKQEYHAVKENIPILKQIIEYLHEQQTVLQKEDSKIIDILKKRQKIEKESSEHKIQKKSDNNKMEENKHKNGEPAGNEMTVSSISVQSAISPEYDNMNNVSQYFNTLAAMRCNQGNDNLQSVLKEVQRREEKNRQQTLLHQKQLESRMLHKSLIKETIFELERDVQRWSNIMQCSQTMMKRLIKYQNQLWTNMCRYHRFHETRLSHKQLQYYQDIKQSMSLQCEIQIEFEKLQKQKSQNIRSKSKSPMTKKQKYKRNYLHSPNLKKGFLHTLMKSCKQTPKEEQTSKLQPKQHDINIYAIPASSYDEPSATTSVDQDFDFDSQQQDGNHPHGGANNDLDDDDDDDNSDDHHNHNQPKPSNQPPKHGIIAKIKALSPPKKRATTNLNYI